MSPEKDWECMPGCTSPDGKSITIYPEMMEILDQISQMGIVIAHELGHALYLRGAAPFGIPQVHVPGEKHPSEYLGFYMEGLARESYGCLPRPFNHGLGAPCR